MSGSRTMNHNRATMAASNLHAENRIFIFANTAAAQTARIMIFYDFNNAAERGNARIKNWKLFIIWEDLPRAEPQFIYGLEKARARFSGSCMWF